MSGYALKIGEIYLRSDKPITEEQRRRAVRYLIKANRSMVTDEGLKIDDIAIGTPR